MERGACYYFSPIVCLNLFLHGPGDSFGCYGIYNFDLVIFVLPKSDAITSWLMLIINEFIYDMSVSVILLLLSCLCILVATAFSFP